MSAELVRYAIASSILYQDFLFDRLVAVPQTISCLFQGFNQSSLYSPYSLYFQIGRHMQPAVYGRKSKAQLNLGYLDIDTLQSALMKQDKCHG
jgi:hypothetical protein